MNSSKTSRIALFAMLTALAGTAFAQSAPAASGAGWAKAHPRRAEVNARLANQNQRIDKEEASGQIGKGKAAQLHKEDHRIRQEERGMAARDGGHITKGEQKALNKQENQVSAQIGK